MQVYFADVANVEHETSTRRLWSRDEVLLEGPQILLLLCWSLVGSVSELRRRVDPFEIHLLQRFPARVYEHRFSQGDDSLLDTWHSTLEDDKIVFHLTVSHKATHTMS